MLYASRNLELARGLQSSWFLVRKSLRGLGFLSVNLFGMVPKLRLEMEPELLALDRPLEDEELFVRLKADSSRRCARTPRSSNAVQRR